MTELAPRPEKIGWLIAAAVTAALVIGARQLAWLETIELRLFDAVQSVLSNSDLRDDIALVLVDDEDISAYGWPLPDGVLADAAGRILASNAKILGFDLFREVAEGDAPELLHGVQEDPRVVWVSRLYSEPGSGLQAPGLVARDYRDGFADFPIDADGVTRRALMLVSTETGVQISFAYRISLLARSEKVPTASASDPTVLVFGQTDLPPIGSDFGAYVSVDSAGYQVAIDYDQMLPIAQTISLRELMQDGMAETLADKIVLIGSGSEVVKDHFRTALNTSLGRSQQPSFTFGAQLHAAVIAQLLDYHAGRKGPITAPGLLSVWIAVGAAALAGAFLTSRSHSGTGSILVGPVMAIALLVGLSLLMVWKVWLPALPVALSWLVSSLLALSVLMAAARRDRRTLRNLFAAHVSSELVEEIWENRELVLSGGRPAPKSHYCTVLFADLVGSTRYGGTVSAGAFGDWLGRFLDRMSQCARQSGGFVEKYTGDGIMVVFGAPVPDLSLQEQSHSAQRAGQCACLMLDAVGDLNRKATEPYSIRVGIHSGEVLCGTFGQTGSRQYSIVGDTANVAARIEAFGKTQSISDGKVGIICLSETTKELLSAEFRVRTCGYLNHDSGEQTLRIFELICNANSSSQ